ncbi:MAG: hypothetical protein HUJ25_14155 [Crocinitomicaceae bacterium]|nr:hypothetical protein [Crocinitomicaceae bacterium]
MKYFIYILILIPAFGIAQQHAASPDTIFLDSEWNITKYRENATYYRQMYRGNTDSTLLVHDYYMSTGNLQMIGTYIHSMKPANQHGKFHYYYENGNLKAVYDYYLGIIHGELHRYYKSGSIQSIEQFNMGTKVDTTWTYFENGQLHKLMILNKDFSEENPSDKFSKQLLIQAYSEEGEVQVMDGKGEYREYFLSGRLKSKIQYENGLPHGKWIKYSGHKKKISCKMMFKRGRFIKGEMYDNGKKDVFSSLERQAYFPTGMRGLEDFLDHHVGRCKDGFKNEVIILVNISTTGKVTLEQIISGNVNACQYEEIQVLVNNMPRWVPAVFDGNYVEGSKSITINFSR